MYNIAVSLVPTNSLLANFNGNNETNVQPSSLQL